MLLSVICTLEERPSISMPDKPIFSSEGCYIRTTTTRVQLKKTLVVSLKGLAAKRK
jgi:hypothetical protein